MEGDQDIALFRPPAKKRRVHGQQRGAAGAAAASGSAPAPGAAAPSGGAPVPELEQQQREEGAERDASGAQPLPQEHASFRQLGVSEWLERVCAGLGMRAPTEVQRGTIPAVLGGRDVIGVAHTGSGKTAAFALPILQRLARDPFGVFALVLTPTNLVSVLAVSVINAPVAF